MIAELAVYDFDGTLYRKELQSPGAYFQSKSVGRPEAPGFDPRWNLPVIVQARRSSLDPRVATVLLTGRPDYKEMREAIFSALVTAGIQWDAVHLKPVTFPGSDAEFKAVIVEETLRRLPEVRKVMAYDDLQENLVAIGQVVQARGLAFVPVWVR